MTRPLHAAILLSALLLALASPASAAFHLWDQTEAFSSPDGTVQFIELTTASNGQHQLIGHEISSAANLYNFPSNLPSNATAGTRFLIGTSSYAALAAMQGAPAPDYTVPDNFFDPAGDTIDFAGFDIVVYAAFPTDGVTSRDDVGGTAVNSPQNFAGATGSITVNVAPPPPPPVAAPSLSAWSLAVAILVLSALSLWALSRRPARSPM